MAKKPFKKFLSKMNKILNDAFDPASLEPIGAKTARQIRVRTRLGKGVDPLTKKQTDLKRLEASTKKSRQRYKKNLSARTTPNTSNLTATGTMIKNIDFRVSRNSIELFFKDAASKNLKNKKAGRISVSRLANIHQKEGAGKKKVKRPFFDLSDFERKELERAFRAVYRKKVRKELS